MEKGMKEENNENTKLPKWIKWSKPLGKYILIGEKKYEG